MSSNNEKIDLLTDSLLDNLINCLESELKQRFYEEEVDISIEIDFLEETKELQIHFDLNNEFLDDSTNLTTDSITNLIEACLKRYEERISALLEEYKLRVKPKKNSSS